MPFDSDGNYVSGSGKKYTVQDANEQSDRISSGSSKSRSSSSSSRDRDYSYIDDLDNLRNQATDSYVQSRSRGWGDDSWTPRQQQSRYSYRPADAYSDQITRPYVRQADYQSDRISGPSDDLRQFYDDRYEESTVQKRRRSSSRDRQPTNSVYDDERMRQKVMRDEVLFSRSQSDTVPGREVALSQPFVSQPSLWNRAREFGDNAWEGAEDRLRSFSQTLDSTGLSVVRDELQSSMPSIYEWARPGTALISSTEASAAAPHFGLAATADIIRPITSTYDDWFNQRPAGQFAQEKQMERADRFDAYMADQYGTQYDRPLPERDPDYGVTNAALDVVLSTLETGIWAPTDMRGRLFWNSKVPDPVLNVMRGANVPDFVPEPTKRLLFGQQSAMSRALNDYPDESFTLSQLTSATLNAMDRYGNPFHRDWVPTDDYSDNAYNAMSEELGNVVRVRNWWESLPPDQKQRASAAQIGWMWGALPTERAMMKVLDPDGYIAGMRQQAEMALQEGRMKDAGEIGAQIDNFQKMSDAQKIESEMVLSRELLLQIAQPDPAAQLLSPFRGIKLGVKSYSFVTKHDAAKAMGIGWKSVVGKTGDEATEAFVRMMDDLDAKAVAQELSEESRNIFKGASESIQNIFRPTPETNSFLASEAVTNTLAGLINQAETAAEAKTMIEGVFDRTVFNSFPELSAATLLDGNFGEGLRAIEGAKNRILSSPALNNADEFNKLDFMYELQRVTLQEAEKFFGVRPSELPAGTSRIKLSVVSQGRQTAKLEYFDGNKVLETTDTMPLSEAQQLRDAGENILKEFNRPFDPKNPVDYYKFSNKLVRSAISIAYLYNYPAFWMRNMISGIGGGTTDGVMSYRPGPSIIDEVGKKYDDAVPWDDWRIAKTEGTAFHENHWADMSGKWSKKNPMYWLTKAAEIPFGMTYLPGSGKRIPVGEVSMRLQNGYGAWRQYIDENIVTAVKGFEERLVAGGLDQEFVNGLTELAYAKGRYSSPREISRALKEAINSGVSGIPFRQLGIPLHRLPVTAAHELSDIVSRHTVDTVDEMANEVMQWASARSQPLIETIRQNPPQPGKFFNLGKEQVSDFREFLEQSEDAIQRAGHNDPSLLNMAKESFQGFMDIENAAWEDMRTVLEMSNEPADFIRATKLFDRLEKGRAEIHLEGKRLLREALEINTTDAFDSFRTSTSKMWKDLSENYKMWQSELMQDTVSDPGGLDPGDYLTPMMEKYIKFAAEDMPALVEEAGERMPVLSQDVIGRGQSIIDANRDIYNQYIRQGLLLFNDYPTQNHLNELLAANKEWMSLSRWAAGLNESIWRRKGAGEISYDVAKKESDDLWKSVWAYGTQRFKLASEWGISDAMMRSGDYIPTNFHTQGEVGLNMMLPFVDGGDDLRKMADLAGVTTSWTRADNATAATDRHLINSMIAHADEMGLSDETVDFLRGTSSPSPSTIPQPRRISNPDYDAYVQAEREWGFARDATEGHGIPVRRFEVPADDPENVFRSGLTKKQQGLLDTYEYADVNEAIENRAAQILSESETEMFASWDDLLKEFPPRKAPPKTIVNPDMPPLRTSGKPLTSLKNQTLPKADVQKAFAYYYRRATENGVDVISDWYDWKVPEKLNEIWTLGDVDVRSFMNRIRLSNFDTDYLEVPSFGGNAQRQLDDLWETANVITGQALDLLTPRVNQADNAQKAFALSEAMRFAQQSGAIDAQAAKAAAEAVGKVMIDYKTQYGADTIFSNIFLYHVFDSRAKRNWLERVLHRPKIAHDYMTIEKAIDAQNDREPGLPQRAYGTFPNPMHQMAENMGFEDSAAMQVMPNRLPNPLRYLVMLNPVNNFVQPDEANNKFEMWWKNGTRFTPGLLPHLAMGIDATLDYMSPMTDGSQPRMSKYNIGSFMPLPRALGYGYQQFSGKQIHPQLGDPYDKGRIGRAVKNMYGEGEVDYLIAGLALGQLYHEQFGTPVTKEMMRHSDEIADVLAKATSLAAFDVNKRNLSRMFTGMSYQDVPTVESEINSLREMKYRVGYDYESNPYGSKAAQQEVEDTTLASGANAGEAMDLAHGGLYQATLDQRYDPPPINVITTQAFNEKVDVWEQKSLDRSEVLLSTTPGEKRDELLKAIDDESQAAIDAIDAKYPSAKQGRDYNQPYTAGMNPYEKANAWLSFLVDKNEPEWPEKPAETEADPKVWVDYYAKQYEAHNQMLDDLEVDINSVIENKDVNAYIDRMDSLREGREYESFRWDDELTKAVVGRYAQDLIDTERLKYSSAVEIAWYMNEQIDREYTTSQLRIRDERIREEFGEEGVLLNQEKSMVKKQYGRDSAEYFDWRSENPEIRAVELVADDPLAYERVMRTIAKEDGAFWELLDSYPDKPDKNDSNYDALYKEYKAEQKQWYRNTSQSKINQVHAFFGWSRDYYGNKNPDIDWDLVNDWLTYEGPRPVGSDRETFGGMEREEYMRMMLGLPADTQSRQYIDKLDELREMAMPAYTPQTPNEYITHLDRLREPTTPSDGRTIRGDLQFPGIPGVTGPPAAVPEELKQFKDAFEAGLLASCMNTWRHKKPTKMKCAPRLRKKLQRRVVAVVVAEVEDVHGVEVGDVGVVIADAGADMVEGDVDDTGADAVFDVGDVADDTGDVAIAVSAGRGTVAAVGVALIHCAPTFVDHRCEVRV
jgi:hypothetical protein